jgi:hypothetical protein
MIDERFEAARKSGDWHAGSELLDRRAPDVIAPVPTVRHELSLGTAVERYLNDATISRSPKSQIVYRTTFATICAFLGS